MGGEARAKAAQRRSKKRSSAQETELEAPLVGRASVGSVQALAPGEDEPKDGEDDDSQAPQRSDLGKQAEAAVAADVANKDVLRTDEATPAKLKNVKDMRCLKECA